MSQNESTPFLVTDAKNLTLIDATRENSPWCKIKRVMAILICLGDAKSQSQFQKILKS